jgi:CRP/FNR family transcriptional regulator
MDASATSGFPAATVALRIAEAFPGLGEADGPTIQRIVGSGVHRKVPADTTMFSERTPCTGFPFVLSGTVRVVQRYPNGRELQLYRVKPGEACLLSGSCLIGHSDYAATGIAESDVELLILPPPAFQALLAEDATFRSYVFGLFGERLAALMGLVEAITYQKLDQRLAAMLVARSHEGGPTLHVTHQALADELGSVREIVSRLLRSFEDRGWVELGRERVVVRDEAALAALAKA